MKSRMAEIENDLRNEHFHAEHEGVQVTVNGDGHLLKVLVDPSEQQLDITAVCADIVTAANMAKQRAEAKQQNDLLAMAAELSNEPDDLN